MRSAMEALFRFTASLGIVLCRKLNATSLVLLRYVPMVAPGGHTNCMIASLEGPHWLIFQILTID